MFDILPVPEVIACKRVSIAFCVHTPIQRRIQTAILIYTFIDAFALALNSIYQETRSCIIE